MKLFLNPNLTSRLKNGSNKVDSLAVGDLREIYLHIARDSSLYAKVQVLRIKAKAKILNAHPLAGKPIPEFSNRNYRELLEGRYRIIYKLIDNNHIDILTVHHSARDLYRRQIE